MTSATPSAPPCAAWGAILGVSSVVIIAVIAALWLLLGHGAMSSFGASMVRERYRLIVEARAGEPAPAGVPSSLHSGADLYSTKDLGRRQLRPRGPNVVGPWGVLQPFADFFKFILKEPIIPAGANKGVFVLAPLVSVVLAFAAWAVIPVSDGWVVRRYQRLGSSTFCRLLAEHGVIMAGWASNSKYALLSALRAAAQMVSYEVSIGFVIVTVVMCAGSVNLSDTVPRPDSRFGF